MPAAADEGERATAEDSAPGSPGRTSTPRLGKATAGQLGRESAGELTLRLLLGVGSLALLGICVLALGPTDWWDPVDHFPNPRIEPE
ncbi:MAG: hypothetical protein ACK5WR_23675, partial [Planctomycetaceae bacterium]